MNSTPSMFSSIMRLTALEPPPPRPMILITVFFGSSIWPPVPAPVLVVPATAPRGLSLLSPVQWAVGRRSSSRLAQAEAAPRAPGPPQLLFYRGADALLIANDRDPGRVLGFVWREAADWAMSLDEVQRGAPMP